MSKSKLILTITTAWLLFFFAFPAFAQYVDTSWVITYNGPGNENDAVGFIAMDSSGNVYVTGDSYGIGTGLDYATIKYYPNGDTAWVRRYNGPANNNDYVSGLSVDISGNVYVTGLEPGPVIGATIKYYPNGDTAWVRRYAGGWPNAIATDDSSNVYVAGELNEGFGTIKYYSNGDTAWVRIFGETGSSWASDLVIDDSGNIYVTGTQYKSYHYNYHYYCTTIKYYPNGDTAWVRTYRYSGNSDDQGYAIGLDHNGNVYVTGHSDYNFTIKYDPNGNQFWVGRFSGGIPIAQAVDSYGNVYVTAPSGSYDNYDYATIKYYPNGDTAWLRRYHGPVNGNNIAKAIAVDGFGNAYVSGYSPGSGTGNDFATIKYYSNGDTAWVRRYNGPGNGSDGASAVAVDDSDNVYVTGWIVSSGTGSDYATLKYWQNHSPVIVAPDSSVFWCAPDTVRYEVLVTDQESWDTLMLSGPGISTPITGPPPLIAQIKLYTDSSDTYQFIYAASDKYGGSDSDTASWVVSINTPPGSFSLLSPQDSVLLAYSVTFDWESAFDPDSLDQIRYDLYVSTSKVFQVDSTVIYDSISTSTHSDSLDRGTYYWKVKAYDSCIGKWSNQSWVIFSGICGDVNGDRVVDVGDVVYMVNYLFKSGTAPNPLKTGNVNSDGAVDVGDVVYLINYLFKSGPPPTC